MDFTPSGLNSAAGCDVTLIHNRGITILFEMSMSKHSVCISFVGSLSGNIVSMPWSSSITVPLRDERNFSPEPDCDAMMIGYLGTVESERV